MKTRLVFLFLAFALLSISFKADETPLEKLLKQLAKITANYPQEKVHLHIDKPYYAIGEDIWIKAYVVTAEKNEPSLLSKVLYIDLIDEKNVIKKKLILPIDKGIASGNININDTIAAGTYRLRSYTNYMRNYPDDFFFEKFVKIGSVLETPQVNEKKEKTLDFKIQFFPEGGSLLAGIRSKIGIKAVNSDGLGINLSGIIINKNKEKVAEFTTEHAGMGIFPFLPLLKENYTAQVKLTDGQIKSFDFPNVLESGYSLAVNTTPDNFNVRIASSANLVNGNDLFVVAQSNGIVYASFTAKATKSILTANIPKKNFPSGIIQFTLFNAQNIPVAERLVFVNNNDQLKIEITNHTSQALTKKKTELSLSVSDPDGHPVDGNFSIVVIDSKTVTSNEDDEITIFSNLLLTSDLKGFIENPNYYFNTANANREKHLDNLLLTQGWRRFIWQDIISQKEPNITFRPEQSLEISGKILSTENKPLPNAKVLMMSNTPGYFLTIDTVSDSKGNFVFDMLDDIPDTASFIFQAKTGKNYKDIILTIDQSPSIKSKNNIGETINILPYLESTKEMFLELNKYNKLDKGILLKQVNIVANKPKPHLNVPNSANASGTADAVITSEMLKKETSLFAATRKIAGMKVNGYERTRVHGLPGNKPPMLIILDGTPVNVELLSTVPVSDIAGVELLISDYNLSVYGTQGQSGVMYVTTKRLGQNPIPATNTAKIKNRGYTIVKQFYSPDYEDPKTNQDMLDLRSTIYWNPNVVTDKNGLAHFSFFNASKPGIYKVVVEGIDSFGTLGRKIITYEVSQLN